MSIARALQLIPILVLLPACLELRLFARVVIVTEETTEPSVGQQVR